MRVQLYDVWENEKDSLEIVCDGLTNGFIGCKKTVTVHGMKCVTAEYPYNITNYYKLMSRMVDGKRVYRPEAGDPCILTDCLLFRIGTKEEWLAADGEPPILDANGELPKPIEDSEPSVVCATVRDADGEIHIECRFDNGEKFAAVIVDGHLGALAKKICYFLNNEAKEK